MNTPQPPVAPDAGRKLVYHKEAECFFYQFAGEWQINKPASAAGALAHLTQCGYAGAVARQMIKDMQIMVVDRFVCRPYEDGILLDPQGARCLNTWVPSKLEPVRGEWPRIACVLNFLTAGDSAALDWLLDWAARKIQDPAVVSGVALVFNGQQGSGKGTFYQIMKHILGPQNVASIGRDNLESRFNAFWAPKLYVLVDEMKAEDGQSLMVSEGLKRKITEPSITLEAKGTNAVAIDNHLTFQFNVNPGPTGIVVEENDRRYTVLENTARLPHDYTALLKDCFNPSGPTDSFMAEIAAFYYDMRERRFDLAACSAPYHNASRADLIHAGKSMHQLFFAEVADRGIDEFIDAFAYPQAAAWDFGEGRGVSLDAVYQAYRDFCKKSGGQALRKNRFQLTVKEVWPLWKPTVDGKQQWALKVPRSATIASGAVEATQPGAVA